MCGNNEWEMGHVKGGVRKGGCRKENETIILFAEKME